ncbi:hypothetical protein EV715DRAFT_297439 [Schizophyllum commune]
MVFLPFHAAAQMNATRAAIAILDASPPRLDTHIRSITQDAMLKDLMTADASQRRNSEALGNLLHRAITGTLMVGKYPGKSEVWYTTAQEALTNANLHLFLFARTGIIRGAMQAKAAGAKDVFDAFIATTWRLRGFTACFSMITEIYRDVCEAVYTELCPLCVHNSLPKTILHKVNSELEMASLATQWQNDDEPELRLNSAEGTAIQALKKLSLYRSQEERFGLNRALRMTDRGTLITGSDWLSVYVFNAILEKYRNAPSDMVHEICADILDWRVISYIPHRLHCVRERSYPDYLIVLRWVGGYGSTHPYGTDLLKEFARTIFVPMFDAACATRFPLFYPDARLSGNVTFTPAMNLPRNHLLLSWANMQYLHTYICPVPSLVVLDNIPDLCDFIRGGAEQGQMTEEEVSAQEGIVSEQLHRLHADEPRSQPSHRHVIACGFEASNGDLAELERRVKRFASAELSPDCSIVRFLAANGKLDGSVILREQKSVTHELFKKKTVLPPIDFEGQRIALSLEVLGDTPAGYARDVRGAVQSIARETFLAHGLLDYRDHLSYSQKQQPLLPPAGSSTSMPLFGRNIRVQSEAGSSHGLIAKESDVPLVDRYGVQFCPRNKQHIGMDIKDFFSAEDQCVTREYVAWIHDDSKCMVVYNKALPQSFVNNLNATRSSMNGVEGTWSYIPHHILRPHVLRIVQQKAYDIRFSLSYYDASKRVEGIQTHTSHVLDSTPHPSPSLPDMDRIQEKLVEGMLSRAILLSSMPVKATIAPIDAGMKQEWYLEGEWVWKDAVAVAVHEIGDASECEKSQIHHALEASNVMNAVSTCMKFNIQGVQCHMYEAMGRASSQGGPESAKIKLWALKTAQILCQKGRNALEKEQGDVNEGEAVARGQGANVDDAAGYRSAVADFLSSRDSRRTGLQQALGDAVDPMQVWKDRMPQLATYMDPDQ